MKTVKELHISIGLPGSGKTTLFKELSKEGGRNSTHIECDVFLTGKSYHTKYKSMEQLLKDRSSIFHEKTFLDGLFFGKSDVARVLAIAGEKKIKVDKVIIHYWKPNKEVCVWNDKGRRGKDSKITIENAAVDDIKDIMTLKDDFKDIKFEKKVYDVVKKSGWKQFADINGLYVDDNGILKGESWCLGGTSGSCWDDVKHPVSPSAAPEGFRELDDLLEKVAPAITFLQYKKIMNHCVRTEEYSDGDYYGGTTYHNRQDLDVRALYEYLLEKELIKE